MSDKAKALESVGPAHLRAGWDAIDRDDLTAAEEIARAALRSDPRDAEAAYLLGSSLLFQDRYPEAVAPLREAYRDVPRKGVGHRLGFCYLALGDLTNAETVLEREVKAYPDLVNARNALGIALVRQARVEEALAVFLEAAKLDPHSLEANSNVGNVLGDLGRYDEAIPYLQGALAMQPGLADTHFNLGVALQSLKRHDEAIGSLRNALELAPRSAYTLSYLLWNEMSTCSWRELNARMDALRSQLPEVPAAPFTFLAVSHSAEEQRDCATLHVREKIPARPAPLWQEARYRHKKIRLAYLSADFREHPVAQLTAGLFERHDRARFEVFGISYGPDDRSAMRRRLTQGFDRFVDVLRLSDAGAAGAVRELEADIAIDLQGHTTGSRPGILAHRPAPVQVSYLGYPGTSGADFIDYVIADAFVVPAEQERFFSEQIVHLPDCFQVNDQQRVSPASAPTRAAEGLPEIGFVFCCFNNSYKLNPWMFDIWMRLLREVPGSVLWLREESAMAGRNLRNEARARAVDPARIVFARRLPALADHLARHRLADLFLDTLPYNAHTTASDALAAGLPLLTCAGSAYAGRVAGSLLRTIGLPELITGSLKDYEALALKLARDSRLHRELRSRLERNLATSPLFDTDRFRRHIEAAYTTMWERAERGEKPQAFAVAPLK
ncbi:MAG TPA: tetratricopeptide repeat protein [Burkholderiales bacterium]|nr:tetratricopeptide repeat protein [Burkholderiales bacterium]